MCERDFLPGRTFYLFIYFHLDSDFLVIAWVVPKQTQATSEKKIQGFIPLGVVADRVVPDAALFDWKVGLCLYSFLYRIR